MVAKQLALLLSLAAALAFRMTQCELGEQCEFVYGGLIYPEGRPPSVEHGLHWSKTQSTNTSPATSLLVCCRR